MVTLVLTDEEAERTSQAVDYYLSELTETNDPDVYGGKIETLASVGRKLDGARGV